MTENEFAACRFADHGLSPRILELRKAYFDAIPEICTERPRLLTRFHRDEGLFKKERITALEKARAYRYVLQTREPVVWHQTGYARDGSSIQIRKPSLFAGSTTSKFKGVILYPEFLGLSLWPELHSLSYRSGNPYRITEKEEKVLNEDVFPYWMDHTILAVARS